MSSNLWSPVFAVARAHHTDDRVRRDRAELTGGAATASACARGIAPLRRRSEYLAATSRAAGAIPPRAPGTDPLQLSFPRLNRRLILPCM